MLLRNTIVDGTFLIPVGDRTFSLIIPPYYPTSKESCVLKNRRSLNTFGLVFVARKHRQAQSLGHDFSHHMTRISAPQQTMHANVGALVSRQPEAYVVNDDI